MQPPLNNVFVAKIIKFVICLAHTRFRICGNFKRAFRVIRREVRKDESSETKSRQELIIRNERHSPMAGPLKAGNCSGLNVPFTAGIF